MESAPYGVEIARIMKARGYDFLFIDLSTARHGGDHAICVAALDAGIAPLVRVPNGELALGTRCLDAGVGCIIPHVDTPEEARAMVDAFRFAPQGHH